MKSKIVLATAIFLSAFVLWGCKENRSLSSLLKGENFDKDASYALGMSIGESMAADGIVPNIPEFVKGLEDRISGKETRLTQIEAMTAIQTAFQAAMETKGAESMKEGTEFLAKNSKKDGVTVTPSGLQYEVITEASGKKPSATSVVRVHYEGTLIDGTVFDSSIERGEPIEFPLDGVIAGWTEGLQLMSIGSKYRLFIPSELGYGAQGGGPIPPHSALIFEVELLDIID